MCIDKKGKKQTCHINTGVTQGTMINKYCRELSSNIYNTFSVATLIMYVSLRQFGLQEMIVTKT